MKRNRLHQIPTQFTQEIEFPNLSSNCQQSTLFEKSNFCPKIQFSQSPNIFTSFSPKFFWQFFSWNQSCQQLKSPKPQHFHEFFTPKKISTIFLGKSKLNFWTKNENFEQCDVRNLWQIRKTWNISVQQLKSPKLQLFYEFSLSLKTILQFFSGNQSWIFGQKMKIVRI